VQWAAVAKPKIDDLLMAIGAEQPAMVATLGADSCIACTRIAVDTLRQLGVRAQPLAVEVIVYNAAAAAHVDREQADAPVVRKRERVLGRVRRSQKRNVGFEQPMAQDAQTGEHRPAENDGIEEGGTLHVLDYVRPACGNQALTHGSDQGGILATRTRLKV
jgi:hypothetical protein